MKHSMVLHTQQNRKNQLCLVAATTLIVVAILSLFIGKYPLSWMGLKEKDPMMLKVFWTLRFPRMLMGVFGGLCLGITGFVFQTIFRNPLASPDIIGVSSGASAGAALGILFFSGALATNLCAFLGALLAVIVALGLSMLDKGSKNSTIVLSGIAVHALAQTLLMCLKLLADPEKELASIEYWIMGSLNGISLHAISIHLIIISLCLVVLFFLHRQVILLSAEESEAKMLGVSIGKMRLAILLVATLAVASTISLTGLISFVGLLAPHIARLLTKDNRIHTMFLSGLLGSILLCLADLLSRSVGSHELPVSIFTSLLGAPFLIYLIFKDRRTL